MLTALEAGAEDVKDLEDIYEILTPPENFETIRSAISEAGYEIESAELSKHPNNIVKVEGKQAEQLLKLMDALDEHEDTQNIYSNFDIDVNIIEKL